MFLPRGELMLNSPKGGLMRGRLSSADTTGSLVGNSTSSHLNEEDLGKFRTKLCERKIIYGYCDHGGGWGCNFSHNLKWLRRNAQKQKYAPRLCASFPACVNGMSCQYAHSREEQFFHPSVYKRLPCLAFPQCRLGQLCPFTHGLGDHCMAASEQLSTEDLYQLVDQQTAVILHTLNLTAEKLVHALGELELEHEPGVRAPDVLSAVVPGRLRSGSLLDVLSEFKSEGVSPASPGEEAVSDKFISLLKGERGFLSHLLVEDAVNAGRIGESTNWKSICKDIVISVSSGKVGVYLGNACVAFEGRMESQSEFACAFDQPCEEKTFRECLVVRCTKPPSFTGLPGVVSPMRVDTDAKNGWVGIFEIDGRRTLSDFLKLEKKLVAVPSPASSNFLLEDCDGQLAALENVADFLVAVKEDRDLLVRQYIIQMIKVIQTAHEAGRCLGGFALDQWQFASGSVDKLLLLPVHRLSKAAASPAGLSEDIRSLGAAVAQLLVGADSVVDAANPNGWLGSLADQRGGLAWDFVVRCVYRSEKETCGELLRHPFLWSWSTLGSVLMRGVAAWFQQSGLLFKPNAQRHLINWAENSFGCTRNEGVPMRRQVFRLAASLDWVPVVGTSSGCANVVATLAVGDKRASPCLVLETGKVNLVKSPGSNRLRDNLLSMLPVCSTDSHLELMLPKHGGKAKSYGKIIDQLLGRFHLTERTSVYSFLSFMLFALSNPHLCMDADVVNKNSQAALIRRHRAVVAAITNAVPLGLLMTCQLAEADNLLDPLLAGGFNSPKRVRSPTTLLLDGRFL